MVKREFTLDGPNGHKFPKLMSAVDLDGDGRYTARCLGCGTSITVTPMFIGDDGFLGRTPEKADDGVYMPCPMPAAGIKTP